MIPALLRAEVSVFRGNQFACILLAECGKITIRSAAQAGGRVSLSRIELQQLADVRLAEANALLAAGMWDGAYYLAGYAVECGLKACIMAYVERSGVIFEDKKFSEKCWTHDLNALVDLAKLKPARDAEAAADVQFKLNWETAETWKETSRYTRNGEADARALVAAVGDATHGVLLWIKRRY
jgi:hypothetical protein